MGKSFAWSFSKLKNFKVCPKRHYEVDLAKNYADGGEAMIYGNEVHAALKNACNGTSPLPAPMSGLQKWVDRYARPGLPGKLLVEQQYAMTKDFQPTAWFGYNVWLRTIVDLLRVFGSVARAVDWKTGKIGHDSRQLMLCAQGIFVQHPEVKRIHTEFVWLKEDDGSTDNFDCVTTEVFDRNTIVNEWPPVLEEVRQMEHAAQTLTYPPKPNKLCARHCPVTSCPFHGKRI